VFIVSSAFCSITGFAFLIFGSSKLQKWNSNAEPKDEKEIKPMV